MVANIIVVTCIVLFLVASGSLLYIGYVHFPDSETSADYSDSTYPLGELKNRIRHDSLPDCVTISGDLAKRLVRGYLIVDYAEIDDLMDHAYVVYPEPTEETGKFGRVWHIDEVKDFEVEDSLIETHDTKSEAIKAARELDNTDRLIVRKAGGGIDFSRSAGLN